MDISALVDAKECRCGASERNLQAHREKGAGDGRKGSVGVSVLGGLQNGGFPFGV